MATWAVTAGAGLASERTAGLAGSICRAKGSGQDGSARLWAQDTGNGEQTCGSQGLGTGGAAGTNRARGRGQLVGRHRRQRQQRRADGWLQQGKG